MYSNAFFNTIFKMSDEMVREADRMNDDQRLAGLNIKKLKEAREILDTKKPDIYNQCLPWNWDGKKASESRNI